MFDFKITDDGELAYNGGTGEVDIVTYDEKLRQLAICRIKSVTQNWFNAQDLGANLEEFLGQTNNQYTVNEVLDRIKVSLNDIINADDIFIIPKVERELLSFIVFIKGITSKTPIVISVKIDIVNGVSISNDIDT